MFLDIQNPDVDPNLIDDYDRLVAAQPSLTSARALTTSILQRIVGAYRLSNNPLAWMKIGPDPADDS